MVGFQIIKENEMRKYIALLTAGALGLAVAGCNAPSTGTVISTTTTVVNDVAAVTKTACGFVPAATTIAQVLNASSTVLTAAQIAQIICQAVNATPTTTKAASKAISPILLEVDGRVVVVNGYFTK